MSALPNPLFHLSTWMFACCILVILNVPNAEAQFTGCTNPGDQTQIPESECNALVDIYDNTNGPGWPSQGNWKATDTPCNWSGITCTAGTVTRFISIGNMNGTLPASIQDLTNLDQINIQTSTLTGIPPEIGNLANLTSLRLSNNTIGGSIPTELGNLSNLVTLNFLQNGLSGAVPASLGNLSALDELTLQGENFGMSIPAAIGNLTGLTTLNLSSSNFTGAIPTELGNMSALQSMNLGSNNFTGGIPTSFGNLTNLTELFIINAGLSGALPAEIGNMSSLQNLTLNSNSFNGSLPPELGNLSNLTSLSMTDNNFTGALPSQLGNLTNLQGISLQGNGFTGSIPSEFGNMSSLMAANINGSNLDGSIPTELGNLSNLQTLHLCQNNLTGSVPASLGNITGLMDLVLCNNNLGGTIPPELGNLTNLTRLTLSENNIGGIIPPELGNMSSLNGMFINGNNLTGPLPVELTNLTNLSLFYANSNDLTGTVPLVVAQMGADLGSGCRLFSNPNLCFPDTPEYQNLTTPPGSPICGVALDPACQPLPVELSSFTSTVHEGSIVLNWETTTESNNAGFFVEHRISAHPEASGASAIDETWKTLDWIEGAGTTTEVQLYAFTVQDPDPGRHMFRLKQVDFDGYFEYSPTLEVILEVPGTHILSAAYPNPFNPQTTFSLTVSSDQTIQIQLFDATGRLVDVLHDDQIRANSVRHFSIDGKALPSGLYVYRATGETFTESRTVLLVK